MKQVLFLSALITVCSSFQFQRADNPKLSLSAFIDSRSGNNLSIKVTLTNNTADTVKYLSWNCYWQASYLIDNDKWAIPPNVCYRNFQETFAIPPYQSEVKILELKRIVGTSKSKNSQLKVGFQYIPPPSLLKPIPIKIEKGKSTGTILWSNTISASYYSQK